MKHQTNGIYLVKNTGKSGQCPQFIEQQIAVLYEKLSPYLTDTPSQASHIVALSTEEQWPVLEFHSHSSQIVYVWHLNFARKLTYDAVRVTLPQAQFLHGAMGLQSILSMLEEDGLLEVTAQADPLAEDVFLRMRGDYLHQLEGELENLQGAGDSGNGNRNGSYDVLINRIAGSAGTYEFERLGELAGATAELIANGEELILGQVVNTLRQTIDLEREKYNRQIEACLPTAVELDVRQRVLVLTDDVQIANQLQFSLCHSRMETTFVNDPQEVFEALNTVQPDILVVQNRLQSFYGLDIAAHVREQEKFEALPILALLEEASEKCISRAIQVGVDGWLTIPFSAVNAAMSVINLLHRMEVARRLGGRDPLTGLYTKEAMLDRLAGDLHRIGRSGQQIAVMLIQLKDAESPRVEFLELVKVAKGVFRRSDILSRYNETTLAVVLPGIDSRTAVTAYNRFRTVLDEDVSVEVATTVADGNVSAESLLADVEIRLTRTMGGSVDAALGVFEHPDEDATSRIVPRILVADTDEAIVNLLRFFCQREGYEVDAVHNGTDVLDYLESHDKKEQLPEMLILESFLPGIDGFQILERINQDYGGRLAVIMLSVRPNEERVAKAFKLGAIDFVPKPFRVPEIIARIKNGLVRSAAV